MSDAGQGAKSSLPKGLAAVALKQGEGIVGLKEVVEIVRLCSECAKELEQQKTEQLRIHERARVQIAHIQSQRELMMGFVDRAFAERRQNFQALFEQLDRAFSDDRLDAARDVLGAIVTLAKTSPLEALRDAISAHEALLDKNKTWVF